MRRRWPLVVGAAGVAIFGLSFVPAWLVHHRELTGEGYRSVLVDLSAWRDVALPVVTAAALVSLLAGAAALARAARGGRVPPRLLVGGSAVAVGLLVASAWPVAQDGYASRVTLTPGWALIVALALGAVMLGGSLAEAGFFAPSRRRSLVVAAVLAIVVAVAGVVGRTVGLNLEEGDLRNWEAGSYTRQATGEMPTETLTLTESTYVIGDRWSGSFESSGGTLSFVDDPACPGVRGSYHAHDTPSGGLRFVRLSDPCADGDRERDLETGIWERDR